MQAIPLIALGLTAASGAIAASSSIQQGQAQKRQARYLEDVAKNDAQQARWQAQYQADRVRERNLRIRATQRAGFLKNRVALSGSAEDVMNDTAIQGELDALAALYSGEVEGSRETAKAELYKSSGQNAVIQARYSAAGSLLGSAGQGVGMYSSWKNPSFESRGKL